MSIGSDDPCPCGSGKSYQYCCMKIGNPVLRLVPSGNSPDQDPEIFRDYREFCEGRLRFGGKVPSFNEFLGRPQNSRRSLDEYPELQTVEKRSHSVEDDVPRAAFLGLSSRQIYELLGSRLADHDSIVALNSSLSHNDFINTPVVRKALAFLQTLEKRGGSVPVSNFGTLDLSFCREYRDFAEPGFAEDSQKPMSEHEIPYLGVVRTLLSETGCLEKRDSEVCFSPGGRDLLAGWNCSDFYYDFLFYYLYGINWNSLYRDIPQDITAVYQSSVEFSLYILKDRIRRGITREEMTRIFLRAFWEMKEEENNRGHSSMETSYGTIIIEDLLTFFGFLEQSSSTAQNSSIIISPLFKKLLEWRIK